MNINTELVEKIKKAKEELQTQTPQHNGFISLNEWFKHLKQAPRVADQKEAEDYKQKLTLKGII